MNNKIKKTAQLLGWTALLAVVNTIVWIFTHDPDRVTHPCFRSTHRADGRPKRAFRSARAANLQSVKQLLVHGQCCTPYHVVSTGRYYTGHSKPHKI